MREKCLFCEMASGERETEFVYEDESVFVIRDIAPQAPVHLLVIPKEHVECAPDIQNPKAWSKALDCAVRTVASLGLDEEGFRLVVNCGTKAGQTIPHLHIHLLAGRFFRWPPG